MAIKKGERFSSAPLDSIPWGDKLLSEKEAMDSGIFWVLSHNVNGLSMAGNQVDVLISYELLKIKRYLFSGYKNQTGTSNEWQCLILFTMSFGV